MSVLVLGLPVMLKLSMAGTERRSMSHVEATSPVHTLHP